MNDRGRRRGADSPQAWLMLLLGALAYFVAMAERTSFGAAGVAATQRFHAGAGIVSLFVVVQMLTYAGMQVPAGLLVDRFGSRLTVTAGALCMLLGQLDLAFAGSVPAAVVARVLVGVGDALTFSSVIKIIPSWFSPRYNAILTQVTTMLGQTGQVFSAVPLPALLTRYGWTAAFLTAAGLAAFSAIVVALLLRSTPDGVALTPPGATASVREQIRDVVRRPGTQMAFWAHWLAGFWGMVFAMMWGIPFLRYGQGRSPAEIGGLFSVFVGVGLVIGPVLGLLTQRHPLRRSNLLLGVVFLTALPWAATLLWPGPAPMWLLVVLMVCSGSAGPGVGIGFDLARTFNPQHRLGTATGVVIVGGFVAALLNIWVIGIVLDVVGRGQFTPHAFRWAMATQFVFAAVGVAGLLEARGRTRARHAEEEGVVVPSWSDALRREWRRHREPRP